MKKQIELYKLAKKVRKNAYAPYSKFQVGAALLDNLGKIHIGCNFENSSYGGTICAERNAIGAMVAAGGTDIVEIVVVTDTSNGSTPCGLCRQVLAEFSKNPKKTIVHVSNLEKITRSFPFSELLPHIFDSKDLKMKKVKTSS